MEIQQHDGVVVDVAGRRQGFAELLQEREVLQGEREAPKAVGCCPPSPPLYRPLGGCASPKRWDLKGGRRPQGGKGGQQHLSLGRLPPPLQHLSLSQKLGEALPRPATSTTTPSCCWISINL